MKLALLQGTSRLMEVSSTILSAKRETKIGCGFREWLAQNT
jgi:hypothetical protein